MPILLIQFEYLCDFLEKRNPSDPEGVWNSAWDLRGNQPSRLAGKTTTSFGGSTVWIFTVPNNLRLTVHAQVFMLDVFANNLGVISSNGVSTAFGERPQMTMIHRAGSMTSTTGSVSRFHGVVSAFDYK